MIIDAKNLILGRLASFIAKKALLGEKIELVNCESAIITGNKKQILNWYKQRAEMGEPFHGPFFPKKPYLLVKRAIRGMLPYKKPHGLTAFKNIRCYNTIPENLKDQKFETVKSANILKFKSLKYVTIKEICDHLGK